MTAEQFDQLPAEEGLKYELLDGELIEVSSPTPKHSLVLLTLARIMSEFLDQHGLGEIITETEFAFPGERRLRPDAAIFFKNKWQMVDLERVPVAVVPDIVVEIISPSESSEHVTRKAEIYIAVGISEVLTVYPDLRLIFVNTRQGSRRLDSNGRLTLHSLPHLDIPVSAVFARI